MPTFYSPTGNPEEWESKPEGYLSVAEWKIAHPEPKPRALTVAEVVEEKLNEVRWLYDAVFRPIDALYPDREREGWISQEAEARVVLADPSDDTPLLSLLVQLRNRGETVSDLARKIIEKADRWRYFYAFFTGQQQKMYVEIEQLSRQEGITADEIAAYRVKYAYPEGFPISDVPKYTE